MKNKIILNEFAQPSYSRSMNNSFEIHCRSRILIIGTSGSGKSTLAREISKALSIPDIELDALFWKPNWSPSSPEEFRRKITEATQNSEGHVIHGNYNSVRDLTWGRADVVIWLDYSKSLVMWRVFKRSIKRILKSETLWEGNQETVGKTFFSKDSIILWAWNTYDLRKKQYNEIIEKNLYPDVKIIRLKKPAEAAAILPNL